MNCFKLSNTQRKVDLNRYTYLHPDGLKLISGWFERAWNLRHASPENCFEPFIFAWFAVNGWAACVTGVDSDKDYLKILMNDEAMTQRFGELVNNVREPLSSHAKEFAEYCPIFEVKDLRRKGILRTSEGRREEVVEKYLDEGAIRFEPECWQEHKAKRESIPVDWPHTLYAICKVRCNLFHGEKAAHSEMDQMIVSKAFATLIHFFKSAQYVQQ